MHLIFGAKSRYAKFCTISPTARMEDTPLWRAAQPPLPLSLVQEHQPPSNHAQAQPPYRLRANPAEGTVLPRQTLASRREDLMVNGKPPLVTGILILPLCVGVFPLLSLCYSLSVFVFVFPLSSHNLVRVLSPQVCLCVFVCVCLCVCVSVPLCLYVSVSLCLCVSVSLCCCVSVSACLCVSVSLCLCVSVSVSLCLCVSLSLCLCVRVSVSVCLRLCVSVSLCLCVSVSCLFVSVSLFLCVSVSPCFCVSVSQCLRVYVSLCLRLCVSVSLCICCVSVYVSCVCFYLACVCAYESETVRLCAYICLCTCIQVSMRAKCRCTVLMYTTQTGIINNSHVFRISLLSAWVLAWT